MQGTTRQTVTIANGASESGELDVAGSDILGIVIPAAWTAAAITFLAATREDLPGNADTFAPLYDDAGNEVTIASAGVVAGRFIALRPDIAPLTRAPWRIKLRSGIAGAAVTQGAARTLQVVLGKIN